MFHLYSSLPIKHHEVSVGDAWPATSPRRVSIASMSQGAQWMSLATTSSAASTYCPSAPSFGTIHLCRCGMLAKMPGQSCGSEVTNPMANSNKRADVRRNGHSSSTCTAL